VLVPLDQLGVLDAMLGKTRRLFDRAQGIRVVRWQRVHRALVAGRHVWVDHASLALEAFGSAVDQDSGSFWVRLPIFISVHNLMHGPVDPPAGLDIIKPSNNDIKVLKELKGVVLNRLSAVGDFDSWTPVHDELRSDLRFVLVNILHAEQELSVQVRQVNLVQVDHVDVLNATQGEVFQDFAA
jgi:hypothetical protein